MLSPRTCIRKRPVRRKLSAAKATSAAARAGEGKFVLLSLFDSLRYPNLNPLKPIRAKFDQNAVLPSRTVALQGSKDASRTSTTAGGLAHAGGDDSFGSFDSHLPFRDHRRAQLNPQVGDWLLTRLKRILPQTTSGLSRSNHY
jgi:hypothetical protein